MAELIRAIRGMNDTLPETMGSWQQLERILLELLTSYGYSEIRFPLIESTGLFKRSIGDVTDIVEKEMYTFTDLNGESISLRPEGTASCVRACLEHGLLHNQQQKLWYYGPMFRHERPQKGRYRQFYQLGVELLNIPGVSAELELIVLCARLWKLLGIDGALKLEINTLGTLEERQNYRDILIAYFEAHKEMLDEDSIKRLHKNPLRILDTKNPNMATLIEGAPKLLDYLGEESRAHFDAVCDGLNALSIPYTYQPRLVRGLDYYGHTVFEWITDKLGSQATVCAGGRYDGLIAQLGGDPTPAVGFAMGIERLLLLLEVMSQTLVSSEPFTVYVMPLAKEASLMALNVSEKLREYRRDWVVLNHLSGGSVKSQFKKADKSRAHFALILGDEEYQTQTVSVKDLRGDTPQARLKEDELYAYLLTSYEQCQRDARCS